MFMDEPGMQFIFSALSGYGEQKAKQDLDQFFSMIDSPKGIHLCGNPDWDFLLGLDMDILSSDIYSNVEKAFLLTKRLSQNLRLISAYNPPKLSSSISMAAEQPCATASIFPRVA